MDDLDAIQRVDFDVGDLAAIVADDMVEERSEDPTQGTQSVNEDTNGASIPSIHSTTSRTRRSFANRKLLATKSLFLRPEHMELFQDAEVEVMGRIVECPRRVNDYRFRVDWRPRGTRHPLPTDVEVPWLREFYGKEDSDILWAAIGRYEDVGGASKEGESQHHSQTSNIDGRPVEVRTQTNATPPRIARGRAAAALQTADSSGADSTTVSTLTSPSATTRRSSTTSNARRARRGSDESNRRISRRRTGASSTVRTAPFDSVFESNEEDGSDLDPNDTTSNDH